MNTLSAFDEILKYKKCAEHDYYYILGCDETSSVSTQHIQHNDNISNFNIFYITIQQAASNSPLLNSTI